MDYYPINWSSATPFIVLSCESCLRLLIMPLRARLNVTPGASYGNRNLS